MITCRDANQLFDRYLDGELPVSLQTELHAHRLSCASCQDELAMHEVCGDVIALDRREPRLSEGFTDRVLLARRHPLAGPRRRWGRIALFVGPPLAAAASIALAFAISVATEVTLPKGEIRGKIETIEETEQIMAETAAIKAEEVGDPVAAPPKSAAPATPAEAGEQPNG